MLVLDTSTRRVGVFIDVQNMYYSARNIYGAKVNFGNIVKTCVGNQKLIRAIAYTISTKTGEERPFFEALQSVGIDLNTKELLEYDSGHKKGDWDVGITIDVVRMLDMLDVVVMVSGDGDYCALAEYVKNRGRIFHVASFRESTSSKLVEAADIYTNLSSDKKAFLLGGEHRRPPERRMSSNMDTFDDVIAEQVANKAIDVPKIEVRAEGKVQSIPVKSEPLVLPIAPVKFNKKPEAEKPSQRRGRPRKPQSSPNIPQLPMNG
ncbi:MAG: NYN domain-containing protein [Patescibacteria group bacterium]